VPVLNTANKVMVGTQAASALYLGTTKVWSSAFDPKSIAGLAVWLDAADVGTITTQWPDKSGLSHHGTIVGSPAPTVQSGTLNGKAVVRFKVNEGRVRGACPAITYTYTFIYVVRMIGPAVGRVLTTAYPPPNWLVGFHTSGMDWVYDNNSASSVVGYPPLPTPWKLYTYTADTALQPSSYSDFYSNGVRLGGLTGGGGVNGLYHLSGYDPAGTQETCDCEVAELLLYDRRLSDVERQQVEGYLRTKWGLV